MTERRIRSIVDLLLKHDLITKVEYEKFVYVLLSDIESLIVIISILILSLISRQFIPTISFLICFFSLRKRTGGYNLVGAQVCMGMENATWKLDTNAFVSGWVNFH